MNAADRALLDHLESMSLEDARAAIHTRAFGGDFGSPNHDLCLSWLANKDAAAALAAAARAEAREERMLSISADSLAIAKESASSASRAAEAASSQVRWAMWAAIIATVAAIIAMFKA